MHDDREANWLPLPAQVAAEVFMHGTGDCGQLGMGEDVQERIRPYPLDIEGRKVCGANCGASLERLPAPSRRLESADTPWLGMKDFASARG